MSELVNKYTQLVRIVISTEKGSRPHAPNFGTRLNLLLDSDSVEYIAYARKDIVDVLETYFSDTLRLVKISIDVKKGYVDIYLKVYFNLEGIEENLYISLNGEDMIKNLEDLLDVVKPLEPNNNELFYFNSGKWRPTIGLYFTTTALYNLTSFKTDKYFLLSETATTPTQTSGYTTLYTDSNNVYSLTGGNKRRQLATTFGNKTSVEIAALTGMLEGDTVFDTDKKSFYIYENSDWFLLSKKSALFFHEEATGAVAGSTLATTWNDRKINTESYNNIEGLSLNTTTHVITIEPGVYDVSGHGTIRVSNYSKLRLNGITGDTGTLLEGDSCYVSTSSVTGKSNIEGRITITTTTTMLLEHYTAAAGALGLPTNVGLSEKYAWLKITQIK